MSMLQIYLRVLQVLQRLAFPLLSCEGALLSMQEGPKPDSISIGSAHTEAAGREMRAEGSREPDQEAVGGTGGFTPAGFAGGPQPWHAGTHG